MKALKGAYALATAMLAVSAVLAVLPKWKPLRTSMQEEEDSTDLNVTVGKDHIQSDSK
jgi:hypothetical protein